MDTSTPAEGLTAVGRIRMMLSKNGYSPIPAKGKIPSLPKWQEKHETNIAEVRLWDRMFPRDTNTGALTRNVPALDFDVLDPAAAAAAPAIIAKYTNGAPILRRVGNPPKFAVPFRTDTPFKKIQVNLRSASGAGAKIEFLGDGQQFIVDGWHPDSKREYEWLGGTPLVIPRAELPPIDASAAAALVNELTTMLVKRLGYTIVGAVKAKPTPNGGMTGAVAAGRPASDEDQLIDAIKTGTSLHDPLRELSAKYIGAGMHPGYAVNRLRDLMMKSDARAARPKEWQERYSDIPRLVDGARVKYGKRSAVDENNGAAPSGARQEPPSNSGGDAISDLNSKYCVVNDGGSVLIFRDRYDDVMHRQIYDRMTAAAFKLLHKNETVLVKAEGDTADRKGIADVWLSHAGRRTYHTVVFDPAGKAAPGVLNLWRGFGFEPKPGDWSKLKDHIKDNICTGNSLYFAYMMNWMALLVQQPAEQGQVAIILRGMKGVGKGILGNVLRQLFGQHGMYVSKSKHLVGAFNSHLRDCVLLFADEAFFAGDRAAEGTLKSLITEDTLTIEPKGQNVILCKNHLHIVMASNEDWVVPASLDERRYFVLDVGDERRQDLAYFAAILEQMKGGGYAAMLHELLSRDISQFQVRKVPNTGALEDQKKHSFKTEIAWFYEVLTRTYIYRSKLGLTDEFEQWIEWASTDLLYASYLDYADRHKERYPLALIPFGKFMTSVAQAKRGNGDELVGETQTISKIDGSKQPKAIRRYRPHGYFMGTLVPLTHKHESVRRI
jgi:Family of unknown function (DUF5906)/Bifunctional DNA primase/polymerase, N-terminal